MLDTPRASLGRYQSKVDATLTYLHENQIIERIWQGDATLWGLTHNEIVNQLGWLSVMDTMLGKLGEIQSLVDALREDGYTTALLLGMGGSSLAAETLRMTFGVKTGYLDLAVLDTTSPAAILQQTERLDPARTVFMIVSKSGVTLETQAFFNYFYNWSAARLDPAEVGAHFITISDAQTNLFEFAHQHNFRATLRYPADLNGRFSALSYVGMLPAALAGIDIAKLLKSGSQAAQESRQQGVEHAGVWLGALMATLAKAGRDKLTLIPSPALAHFGLWIEHLVADSLGKQGRAIVPIAGEALLKPKFYGSDRLFVYLRLLGDNAYDVAVEGLRADQQPVVQIDLTHLSDLGAEFFRWQMATAVAAHLLDVNPFEQAQMEAAKLHTQALIERARAHPPLLTPLPTPLPTPSPTAQSAGISIFCDPIFASDTPGETLAAFLKQLSIPSEYGSPSYVSIHAYLTPNADHHDALTELRTQIQRRTRLATTLGFGPRLLHSTGQMHKGGTGHGLFVQLTASDLVDADIPDEAGSQQSSLTFGALMAAQSLGDHQALREAGRRVIRFDLSADVVSGIERLVAGLRGQ